MPRFARGVAGLDNLLFVSNSKPFNCYCFCRFRKRTKLSFVTAGSVKQIAKVNPPFSFERVVKIPKSY